MTGCPLAPIGPGRPRSDRDRMHGTGQPGAGGGAAQDQADSRARRVSTRRAKKLAPSGSASSLKS